MTDKKLGLIGELRAERDGLPENESKKFNLYSYWIDKIQKTLSDILGELDGELKKHPPHGGTSYSEYYDGIEKAKQIITRKIGGDGE